MKSMSVKSTLNESLPRCWWVSAEKIFNPQGYVSTLTQHWFNDSKPHNECRVSTQGQTVIF